MSQINVDTITDEAGTGAVNFSTGITGNLTGNVTGNLTGNVIGNLTGNVTSTGTPVENVYAISGTSVALEPDNGSSRRTLFLATQLTQTLFHLGKQSR